MKTDSYPKLVIWHPHSLISNIYAYFTDSFQSEFGSFHNFWWFIPTPKKQQTHKKEKKKQNKQTNTQTNKLRLYLSCVWHKLHVRLEFDIGMKFYLR